MFYDFGAFSGHWPFRHLRGSTTSEMLKSYHESGIDGGLMSSLDAVFYNDPWEADLPLLHELHGTRWKLAMSVNPKLPWTPMALQRGKEAGAAAIRLYPCVHDYRLTDAAVVNTCRFAAELGLPVIITSRLDHDWFTYILQQREPNMAELQQLLTLCPQTRYILSNYYLGEVTWFDRLPEHVWIDVAGLRQDMFPFEVLESRGIPMDRVLFGSLAPLQCLSSVLLNIPEHLKQRVMRDNCQSFLDAGKV